MKYTLYRIEEKTGGSWHYYTSVGTQTAKGTLKKLQGIQKAYPKRKFRAVKEITATTILK